MNADRRTILRAALVPFLFPFLPDTAAAAQGVASEVSEIRVIMAKDPTGILDRISTPDFSHSLAQSVLSFIIESYPKANLPVWKKPLSQVGLHERIPLICDHVAQAVTRHASIYPVDPCWIMGQMMAESFFHEFAVSSALAVGPCQFIAPTARGYGLVCADAHGLPPESVRRPDLEKEFGMVGDYRDQMKDLRQQYSSLFNSPAKILRKVLAAQTSGKALPEAATYTAALQRMENIQAQHVRSRDNCQLYFTENFQGRSIFDPQDVAFFERFEQRVLYSHSINAMVRMMAENMRSRNGNILAATAAYNAGLGNTDYESGIYIPYGRIPNFSETVDYVSKIVINHHEISRRI